MCSLIDQLRGYSLLFLVIFSYLWATLFLSTYQSMTCEGAAATRKLGLAVASCDGIAEPNLVKTCNVCAREIGIALRKFTSNM